MRKTSFRAEQDHRKWEEDRGYAAYQEARLGESFDPKRSPRLLGLASGGGAKDHEVLRVLLLEAPTQALETAFAHLAQYYASTMGARVYVVARHAVEDEVSPDVFQIDNRVLDHVTAIEYLAQRHINAVLTSQGGSIGAVVVSRAATILDGMETTTGPIGHRHRAVAVGPPGSKKVPPVLRAVERLGRGLWQPMSPWRCRLNRAGCWVVVFAFCWLVIVTSYPMREWAYWLKYWMGALLTGRLRVERVAADAKAVCDYADSAIVEGNVCDELRRSPNVTIVYDPGDWMVDVRPWDEQTEQVIPLLGLSHNPTIDSRLATIVSSLQFPKWRPVGPGVGADKVAPKREGSNP